MGKITEQTFFQRGDADGQQAHAKMLNITNHQGNSNQNHNEIPPHTCQNDYHQREHKKKVKKKIKIKGKIIKIGDKILNGEA